MALPGNQATTPFKTMDIKAALLACGNRKRKASSSQVSKDEPKNKKLSVENSDHENVEIIDETCGITVTLQSSDLDSTLGDCKENKDINTTKLESPVVDSSEKSLLSPTKEELLPCVVNKKPCNSSNIDCPKSPKLTSDNDVELLSDKSEKSNVSSCDELSKSMNRSLNTSGLSVTGEDELGVDKGNDLKSKKSIECDEKSKKSAEKVKKKKMTPAEAKKRAEERERKQKEMKQKREEIEAKKKERQLEKERKHREKMLLEERKELERKERERAKQEKKDLEEKERLQKQKEKEEKAKHKQLIQELKLEEKKKKEEMKLKREEELKKAEEEKLKAKLEKEQKEKEKQERAKAAFAKFFVKAESNTIVSPPQAIEKRAAFLPFQVSDDMTLAPVVPPAAQERFNKKQLDHYLEHQDSKELYLQILKTGSYKDVRHRKKNRKFEEADPDVIVIDKNAQAELGLCPKLLQFSENVRPPYWGTWRKKSKNIRPRNPFAQDDIFDYSVDSDDEWDEGGPGESLSGTENEIESEDDYEVDNEFFVPHGYLSDEEEKKEDDDEEVNDPEKQKALLKLKLQEFEMERKKKTTELKPIIMGCYFVNDPVFQDNGLKLFLKGFSAEILSETPIPTCFTIKNQQNESGNNTAESPKASSNSAKKKKILSMPEEAFPQLIRLVHGNTKNKRILAEEFQKFWADQSEENSKTEPLAVSEIDPLKESSTDVLSVSAQISLKSLTQTIREIASYGKSPDAAFNKCCWWVHDNIREKYDLLDAPIPNQWKYVSQKEPEPVQKSSSASIKEFLSPK